MFQFKYPEDGKKALEQLNGFELAGRVMKVKRVEEEEVQPPSNKQQRNLDTDDGRGLQLGSTGRLQLMSKLAQSSGVEIPQVTQQVGVNE